MSLLQPLLSAFNPWLVESYRELSRLIVIVIHPLIRFVRNEHDDGISRNEVELHRLLANSHVTTMTIKTDNSDVITCTMAVVV